MKQESNIIDGKKISSNILSDLKSKIDKENIKQKKDDITQCTGDKYMLTDDDKFLTREQKISLVLIHYENEFSL